tara:strand:- start:3698 stop:4111 length:414 start_codon:yes stop_codon:yes gene_type:complete
MRNQNTNEALNRNTLVRAALESALTSWLQMPVRLHFEVRYNGIPHFVSQDIAASMSPQIFSECEVVCRVWQREDGTYGTRANLSHTHFNGGSNGFEIGRIEIAEDGEVVNSEHASVAHARREARVAAEELEWAADED